MPALDRTKQPSTPGRVTFVFARLGVALFQHWLLLDGAGDRFCDWLGYPSPSNREVLRLQILFYAHLLFALRQAFWAIYLSVNTLPIAGAIGICIFNGVLETTASLIALRNTEQIGLLTYLGVALVLIGSIFESGSEIQRKWFKQKPENAGKPFTGGLFAWAQHINYFGYTLCRAGVALISGSLVLTVFNVAFLSRDFITAAIPDLQRHNREKYGKLFENYAAKTAKFIPFVY